MSKINKLDVVAREILSNRESWDNGGREDFQSLLENILIQVEEEQEAAILDEVAKLEEIEQSVELDDEFKLFVAEEDSLDCNEVDISYEENYF